MAGRSKLLFLVEDDANVLLMTSLILARLGYSVKKFTSGEEALAAIGVLGPHIVVCDFNLPDLTGVEVLDAIRQRAPSVFRVMVTGNAGDASVQSGLDSATVQVLLEKPFSIKSLCEALFLVERGETGRVFRYKH